MAIMSRDRHHLTHDPTAAVECHEIDNRFVPLRICDLVSVLAEHCGGRGLDAEACGAFVKAVTAVIEQEAAAFQRELEDTYSFFNPDRETLPWCGDASARTSEGYRSLAARLEYLLDKANFERLDDVAVDRAVQVASTYGFRVQLDPSRIEDFSIYVRGEGTIERTRWSLRAPIRGRPCTLPVYRRLVVIARLKGDPHVLIKMFKDIPEEDVEALLPHAEVRMNWSDRLFMLGGGAGVVGSTGAQVAKIVSASLLALSRLLWVVAFGFCVLVYRTFNGYRMARHKRDSQRTRHLYFQNVANNAGTLSVLVSMIAQEDIKEAVLAYLLCATGERSVGSPAELQARADAWLKQRFGIDVDFDADDAILTLDRLGLWQDRAAMQVTAPSAAISKLREQYHNPRTADFHSRKCQARG
jgi:hypothetical protein